MKCDYMIMQEEPVGCFPVLAKTVIAQLPIAENYLTAIFHSDASHSVQLYASSYSIMQEGFVPLVYRQDENIFPQESEELIAQLKEILEHEQIESDITEKNFINLL